MDKLWTEEFWATLSWNLIGKLCIFASRHNIKPTREVLRRWYVGTEYKLGPLFVYLAEDPGYDERYLKAFGHEVWVGNVECQPKPFIFRKR